jgi:hypothetical protein
MERKERRKKDEEQPKVKQQKRDNQLEKSVCLILETYA